jgi:hypothetical protein
MNIVRAGYINCGAQYKSKIRGSCSKNRNEMLSKASKYKAIFPSAIFLFVTVLFNLLFDILSKEKLKMYITP